jgi:cbb3-type cytochrome oxidase subunit 3
MKQEGLKYFLETEMTLIALILFLFAFSFLIFRVYFYEKKENFDKLSQIPLKDEENNHV